MLLSSLFLERENPEGESAEQSMELGLGGKDPISGDSVGSRNLLPRLLVRFNCI